MLQLERVVHVDVEPSVIALTAGNALGGVIGWAYGDIHIPVLFVFMSAACLLAPDRYPFLRTTFVLSFVPAALVIGLYPLAPPKWLSELGLGPAPAQEALTGTFTTLAGNSTAAAASQHFGYAFFIAAASLWLWPRAPAAWATLAYPAFVFVVIVGTANHYVLDCIVGALAFAFGAACAAVPPPRRHAGTDAALDARGPEPDRRLHRDRVGRRVDRGRGCCELARRAAASGRGGMRHRRDRRSHSAPRALRSLVQPE